MLCIPLCRVKRLGLYCLFCHVRCCKGFFAAGIFLIDLNPIWGLGLYPLDWSKLAYCSAVESTVFSHLANGACVIPADGDQVTLENPVKVFQEIGPLARPF